MILNGSFLFLTENPLSCDCDSTDFWEWLQNHPKIFAIGAAVSPSPTAFIGEPKFVCEKPEELRGKLMIEIDIPSLCAAPAIVKLAIQVSNVYHNFVLRTNFSIFFYLKLPRSVLQYSTFTKCKTNLYCK